MVRLRHWIFAGAAVPAALVVVPGLVAAVAAGVDGFVTALGVILLSLLLVVPPGALAGLVLGIVVLAVARRLPSPGAPGRGAALLFAVAAIFALSVGAAAVVLRFTASDGIGWRAYVGTSAFFAVIPTVLAAVAWRRWRPVSSSASAPVGDEPAP